MIDRCLVPGLSEQATSAEVPVQKFPSIDAIILYMNNSFDRLID